MALLDWIQDARAPGLRGDRVVLRAPRISDHTEWADLRGRSRAYLQPWEPTWPEDDLSRTAFRRRLSVYEREMEAGHAYPFFAFDSEGGNLLGAVTLSNVRRGVAETGTLGYWIGQPHAGQGRATDAVRAVVGYAFGELNLHRVEASCLPTNVASRRVLEKAGFRHEGQARAYLKINGDWSDHLLFGVVSDEFSGAGHPVPDRG